MDKLLFISLIFIVGACSTGAVKKQNQVPEEKALFSTNNAGRGQEIIIDLTRGKSFYYPLFSIWLEDMDGKYIQTLYVARSVATGIFEYAKQEKNKWIKAPKRAPQALPLWSHKRGIKAADGLFTPDEQTAVPDAYTGATPVTGFIMTSHADYPLPGRFKVMAEINQNWDWNEYWTNDKYPGDENYKWSCQPAVVYETVVYLQSLKDSYRMKPVGHSHYSGKTGELFPDLSTLTTALQIADSIIVKVK
jgi:hypothetical protein